MRNTIAAWLMAVTFGGNVLMAADSGWIQIFNGKDLSGWTVSTDSPKSIRVEDGLLVISGPRAHLFYTGEVANHDFKDFEFKARVKTFPKANSGIYFHTAYQADGWPRKGYECQVNQTHGDPKKTGGLYGVADNMDKVATDGEWFDYNIRVQGKHIVIKINGKTVTDYTGTPDAPHLRPNSGRRISSGTFAIQAHDPNSLVHYKDIFVKVLED